MATELQAKEQPVPENHKMVSLQGPGTEDNGTFLPSGLLARVPRKLFNSRQVRHFPTP